MNEPYDAAIDSLQKEIAERMRMVNGLCKLSGRKAIYSDAEGAVSQSAGTIRPDQWYTSGLSTAAREFLQMRQAARLGPATADEIHAALTEGGFRFDAKDVPNAKAGLKQSLTKNTSIFHRLPQGTYGLAAWYPNVKSDGPKENGTAHRRSAKPSKAKKTAEHRQTAPTAKAANPMGAKQTLLGAVKEAMRAMPGAFVKYDILNWVNAEYPELKAKKLSVFSMITHLREEMKLTVTKGEGHEPSKYRVGADYFGEDTK